MAYIDGVTYNGTDYSLYCSGGKIDSGNSLVINGGRILLNKYSSTAGSETVSGSLVLTPASSVYDVGAITGIYQGSGAPDFPQIMYLLTANNATSLYIGNRTYYDIVLDASALTYRHSSGGSSVDEKFTFKSDFTLNNDGTILTINLD